MKKNKNKFIFASILIAGLLLFLYNNIPSLFPYPDIKSRPLMKVLSWTNIEWEGLWEGGKEDRTYRNRASTNVGFFCVYSTKKLLDRLEYGDTMDQRKAAAALWNRYGDEGWKLSVSEAEKLAESVSRYLRERGNGDEGEYQILRLWHLAVPELLRNAAIERTYINVARALSKMKTPEIVDQLIADSKRVEDPEVIKRYIEVLESMRGSGQCIIRDRERMSGEDAEILYEEKVLPQIKRLRDLDSFFSELIGKMQYSPTRERAAADGFSREYRMVQEDKDAFENYLEKNYRRYTNLTPELVCFLVGADLRQSFEMLLRNFLSQKILNYEDAMALAVCTDRLQIKPLFEQLISSNRSFNRLEIFLNFVLPEEDMTKIKKLSPSEQEQYFIENYQRLNEWFRVKSASIFRINKT